MKQQSRYQESTACLRNLTYVYALLPRLYLATPLISRAQLAQIVQKTNRVVLSHMTRASLPRLHSR